MSRSTPILRIEFDWSSSQVVEVWQASITEKQLATYWTHICRPLSTSMSQARSLEHGEKLLNKGESNKHCRSVDGIAYIALRKQQDMAVLASTLGSIFAVTEKPSSWSLQRRCFTFVPLGAKHGSLALPTFFSSPILWRELKWQCWIKGEELDSWRTEYRISTGVGQLKNRLQDFNWII